MNSTDPEFSTAHEAQTDEQDDATLVAGLVREVYRSATVIAGALGRATGIHATDADALRVLDAAVGRPTMGHLGAELGLSSAAVTALVDRLEHAGLARRVHDDVDRRRVRVELTEVAHELASSHLAPLMGRMQAAIDATQAHDLSVVAAFLARLLDNEE